MEFVAKDFGDFQALKDVSLTINAGEFFSLLGPSGCGKTTLLRIIGGMEDPSSGVVYMDGTKTSFLYHRTNGTSTRCSRTTPCFPI